MIHYSNKILLGYPAVASVWNTRKLVAGPAIAVRWAEVIRGTSIPEVVEVISSMALAFGAAPVAFIPTCAFAGIPKINRKASKTEKPKIYLFIK